MNDEKENQKVFSIGLEVPLSVLAGSFFGFGSVFLKKAMSSINNGLGLIFNPLSWAHWNFMISSIVFWISLILIMTGLGFWVLALHKGKVSIVGPIVGGFVVFAAVISGMFGIVIDQEPFSLKKAIGILAITIGSMGLARKERH